MISIDAKTDLQLRAGDTDSYGDQVTQVYDRAEGAYIIYQVSNGALKCGDHGIKLEAHEKVTHLVMKIGDLFAVSPALARKYNSHRAFGFRFWCRGETEAAAQAFEETFGLMLRSFTRRARLLYISGSFLVILFALVALAAAAYTGSTSYRTWSLIALFGAVGASVSVALRGQPPTLDVLEDYPATLLYGIVRALVAVVFALLVYLLVLGGVLLPDLARESSSRLLVLAFVAGFSEKLVPEAVIHQAIGGGGH